MKRQGSSIPQFVQRIPADVRARAIGLTLVFSMIPGALPITISPAMTAIRFSLRARDPGDAKIRQAKVAAYLETVWQALRRSQPVYVNSREAHALAGELYRAWVAGREHDLAAEFDPATRTWAVARLREVAGEEAEQGFASVAHRLATTEPENMEAALGPILDRQLLARGIASIYPECRPVLLNAFAMALQDAFEHRSREAAGDYTPDPKALRFPPLSEPEAYGPPKGVAGGGVRGPVLGAGRPVMALSLSALVELWWQEAEAAGTKPGTHRSYRNVVRGLITFLKHDVLSRVTAEDILRFKDHRLASGTVSARTVKHGTISALKTIFGFAVANKLMPLNPASGITIKLGKARKLRSKGFTEQEAVAILVASRAVAGNGKTAVAKRWVPWLLAYTGARVGEIAQLRKQDLRREGSPEHWVLRITPEAGTVKTNEAREVVLHPHLVEQGFPTFVACARPGPLFLRPAPDGSSLGPLRGIRNRLREFARQHVTDPNVAPNHGWRHRFKTVGMEAGIAPRILDAIQGQAPVSAADGYGDVTLKTQADAMLKFPRINIEDETIR